MTTLVDRAELGGHALVYLPKYLDPDDPVFALSDGEIAERFLAALERMVPGLRPRATCSASASRACATSSPSRPSTTRERLPPTTTSVPGLHLVNAAHIANGTLNVNETIQLADRAAARALCGARMKAARSNTAPGDGAPPGAPA